MAAQANVTVGYFIVTSYCQRSGSPVKKIPLGSTDVEHVIEFENGATLPCDGRADTEHPDSPALIEFSHGGGPHGTSWSGEKSKIGSGDKQKIVGVIRCVTAASADAVIQTPTIQYRVYSSVNSAPWLSDPTCTTLLEIKMPIR